MTEGGGSVDTVLSDESEWIFEGVHTSCQVIGHWFRNAASDLRLRSHPDTTPFRHRFIAELPIGLS
jgi:hypothetical protein